jgi:hypothetical protein
MFSPTKSVKMKIHLFEFDKCYQTQQSPRAEGSIGTGLTTLALNFHYSRRLQDGADNTGRTPRGGRVCDVTQWALERAADTSGEDVLSIPSSSSTNFTVLALKESFRYPRGPLVIKW